MNTFVEQDCTFTHEGKAFSSGGAVVTDDYLIAYIGKFATVTDWHGNEIGTYKVISSRPAVFFGRRSWQGSTYYHMRAWLRDGRIFTLRGFGEGMVAKGKRVHA